MNDIQPESVLDAGCAWGFLVEKLRERRIEAFGIDISPYAIENVHPDIAQYCTVGSIIEPFSQLYDLIVCIEVLEHMPKDEAERAVKNICDHTGDVLFSSTPFDYKEATHFNVQPPEFWAELFARYSFFRDVDFDASFITPWAVRFRRKHDPLTRLVRDYERKLFLLAKENSDLRSLSLEMRDQISQLDQTTKSLYTEQENMKADRREIDDQLSAIHKSRGWIILQRIQKLRMQIVPPGSSREKAYLRIFNTLEK
ncbi:MAG: class I SAM-dependent methyltransferase [Anaerolineales bacterium]|nr:class I SAM-dependent methyltransferase [Anaerolineales bacterium]